MKFLKNLLLILMLSFSITSIASPEQKAKQDLVTTVKNAGDTAVSYAKTAMETVKTGTVNATNYADTSSLFKEIYRDVRSGIIAMATALKTTVEHVMYILIRQQYILGALSVLKLLLILLFVYLHLIGFHHQNKSIYH